MLKYTILTVALVISNSAILATESFVYRETSTKFKQWDPARKNSSH